VTCATVQCGACGFQARIEVVREGRTKVRTRITSGCEAVLQWAETIETVDWRKPLGEVPEAEGFWRSAFQQLRHRSCPVPMAVLKSIEVEIGAALPVDVHLQFLPPASQTALKGNADD
jgi:hypothetical protein